MSLRHSDEIDQLFASLSEAQGAIENARKDEKNPHFRSSYADLASVRDAIRGPLAAQGLSVLQFPTTDIRPLENGGVWMGIRLITRLCLSSGQWIEDELVVPLARQDAQSIGSAITYARRYSLMAVTGVAPEEDDGEAAVGRGAPAQQGQGANLGYPFNGQGRAPAQQAPAQADPATSEAEALAFHQNRLQQAPSLASLKALFSSSQKDLLHRGCTPESLEALTKTKDAMKASLEAKAAEAPADAGADQAAAAATH
ncbi:MAG: ERF family protein [Halomonas sp.]